MFFPDIMWYFKKLLFLPLFVFLLGCAESSDFAIYISERSSEKEHLAAKEIRRYFYLRTGEILRIKHHTDTNPYQGEGIIIGTNKNNKLVELLPDSLKEATLNLTPEGFVISTFENRLVIVGSDEQGLLYGGYRLSEHLGIRFYLEGDVIPDLKTDPYLPEISEIHNPLFTIRGILPFHDFPEGPDWWNTEDYLHYITQLGKLKMNFIGFHAYPESRFQGAYKAEPLVWIGPESEMEKDGKVKKAYPMLHFNTGDTTWGYMPKRTSDYSNSAGTLFEKDFFGAGYLPELSPWPHTANENIQMVNNMGDVLNRSFIFAEKLGVKTCLGTETPLTIPEKVKNRLTESFPELPKDSLTKMLYAGMFERIVRTHPLDYYWFWTPENWTWQDVPDKAVENTITDLQIAVDVAKEMDLPFTLATCGWVLGPPRDRTEFDEFLPEDMPFSCINRYVGFSRIEPAFQGLRDRPLWAIPWLEDDPALISPQFWAGRMRKDAFDAFQYGCNGLIGIHWRTRIIGPTLSALAQAGWSMDPWRNFDTTGRDISASDFYQDWASKQFGNEHGANIAEIFSGIDGGPEYDPDSGLPYQADLFRTSIWDRGPGGIKIISEPWSEVSERFQFIDEFKSFENKITGKGNKERYSFWLNTFLFAKETARLGCNLGMMDQFIDQLNELSDPESRRLLVEEKILPLRLVNTETYDSMMDYLLSSTSNTSELGTIANLEQHNRKTLQRLSKYDSLIGIYIPDMHEKTIHDTQYDGPSRILVQAPLSIIEKNHTYTITIRVLSGKKIKKVIFHWAPMGSKSFASVKASHLNRNVFQVSLNPENILDRDFEYFIEAELEDNEKISWPPTADNINQTVIVF